MKHGFGIALVILALALVGFSGIQSTSPDDLGVSNDGATGTQTQKTGQGAGTAGKVKSDLTTTGSTGGTTGTTGTTGTSGTGSTGGTTGGAPWQGMMRVERIEEHVSQTAYSNSGGTTQVNTGVHFAWMLIQVGGPASAPTGSTTVYVNGQPVVCPWQLYGYGYSVGVLNNGQEGLPRSNANPGGNYSGPGGSGTPYAAAIPTNYTQGNWVTSPGVSCGLQAYGEVPVGVATAGPIAGAQLQITVGLHVVYYYVDPNTNQNVYIPSGQYSTYSINFSEIAAYGYSIDSRRTYGQPNLAGELPADPNAPPRNVNFFPWVYRGGGFVGYIPFGASADHSGLGRMQLWGLGGASGTCLAGTAVLFDRGARNDVSGAESVGVFIPDSGDSPFTAGLGGSLTWANRWQTINPTSSPGTPVDYANTPVATLNLGATNTNDYLNWIIADTSSGGWIIPPGVFNTWCFALTNEAYGPSWHNFGSWSYAQAHQGTFPANDCQPRMWYAGLTGTTSFPGPF